MALYTNLKGRKRNTKLLPKDALLPLFEAVVNSIEAIEESKTPMINGHIMIDIIRQDSSLLPLEADVPEKAIRGFKITDNGIGFNNDNFHSFETLDTDYKASKGCRGVGRLLWLKAFEQVSITSSFKHEESFKKRSFIFDENGVSEPEESFLPDEKEGQTIVFLRGFLKKYRSQAPTSIEKIAEVLFEHCLWYFIQPGGAPSIVIRDSDKSIIMNELYEKNIHTKIDCEAIPIKSQIFDLMHIKLRHSAIQPKLFYCAAHRPVKITLLKDNIAGLFGRISNQDEGDFNYICHVSSNFFDERVASDRTEFEIAEEIGELLSEVELSFKEIDEAVFKRISEYLEKYLEENKRASEARIRRFVDEKAPQYRPLLEVIQTKDTVINPDRTADRDVELILHNKKSALERELLIKGQEILKSNDYGEDYQKSLDDYLLKIEVLKRSELTAYVLHRWKILDILDKLIKQNREGKYPEFPLT